MVVQHNLTAMNANRMLGITTGQQAKTSEKLSSGYRINRAADDAAGLSISEKMRKQINGLDRASTNAQDGVSAVQTAEGALSEVHSMLQRMNELSVQAANGTNSLEDREAIQAEMQQLTTEIDRVAETTKFNETYLLKGAPGGATKTIKVLAHDAGIAGKLVHNGNGTSSFQMEDIKVGDKIMIAGKEYEIVAESDVNSYAAGDYSAGGVGPNGALQVGDKVIKGDTGETIEITANTTIGNVKLVKGDIFIDGRTGERKEILKHEYAARNLSDVISDIRALQDTDTVTINGTPFPLGTQDGQTAEDAIKLLEHGTEIDLPNGVKRTVIDDADDVEETISISEAYKKVAEQLKIASDIGTDSGSTVANRGDGTFVITQGTVDVPKELSFMLHVGTDADMSNKIGVNIESMTAAGLGIKGLNIADTTGIAATYAIDSIADAITKVSEQRSSLGAIQNRLEHTIANLDNVVENTTAAESRIRDTDMAEEMVEHSKNNILAQAGQAMLAQANQSTQGVLSLLQ